jgi:hypothetical protein
MLYTYDDVKNIDGYKEGNFVENFKLVLKYLSDDNTYDMRDWVVMEKDSTNKTVYKCVCSHRITTDFYLQNPINKKIILVGCSCVNKLLVLDGKKAITYEKNRRLHNPCCLLCKKKMSENFLKNNPDAVRHNICKKKQDKIDRDTYEQTDEYKKIQFQEPAKTAMNYVMGENTKYPNLKLKKIYVMNFSYIRWLSLNCYNDTIKDHCLLLIERKNKLPFYANVSS